MGLYALENVAMQRKFNNVSWFSHQLLNQAENILKVAEKNYLRCMVPTLSMQELKNKSLSWWQNACNSEIEDYKFFYITEWLGEDACSGILPDKKMSANYYRITLLDLRRSMRVLLQSIYIDSNDHVVNCKEQIKVVSIGRQGMHEVR
jgi:hypothetical protein